MLLQGKTPSLSECANFGTQNYLKIAGAVIAGAAYGDEAWEMMRKACKGISKVLWLRPDLSKLRPLEGLGYTEAIVERVKVCMRGLIEDWKMEEDRVYFY